MLINGELRSKALDFATHTVLVWIICPESLLSGRCAHIEVSEMKNIDIYRRFHLSCALTNSAK